MYKVVSRAGKQIRWTSDIIIREQGFKGTQWDSLSIKLLTSINSLAESVGRIKQSHHPDRKRWSPWKWKFQDQRCCTKYKMSAEIICPSVCCVPPANWPWQKKKNYPRVTECLLFPLPTTSLFFSHGYSLRLTKYHRPLWFWIPRSALLLQILKFSLLKVQIFAQIPSKDSILKFWIQVNYWHDTVLSEG